MGDAFQKGMVLVMSLWDDYDGMCNCMIFPIFPRLPRSFCKAVDLNES
jgi:hypothetical protein